MMNEYPGNYKFTSVDLFALTTIKKTERNNYDLLQTFGDVGGVNEVFTLILSQLAAGFAYVTGTSLLAKGLYKEEFV
jgi:hypothetical protein